MLHGLPAHLCLPVLRQQHVRTLDIHMYHPVLVEVMQGLRHIQGDSRAPASNDTDASLVELGGGWSSAWPGSPHGMWEVCIRVLPPCALRAALSDWIADMCANEGVLSNHLGNSM